jgi:hypothetical protein
MPSFSPPEKQKTALSRQHATLAQEAPDSSRIRPKLALVVQLQTIATAEIREAV